MSEENNDKKNKFDIDVGRDFEIEGDVVGGDKIGGDRITAEGNVEKNEVGRDQYRAEKIIINHPAPVQPGRPLTREEKKARQTCQRLIEVVRYTWIDSILKPAVENDIYIDLGMSKQRNAVPQPRHQLLPDEEPLPEGTTIRDVFEKHGRKILILGEPASGKTITLLSLADMLLTAAEEGENDEPIPVVLNLASWARERSVLTMWLGEEMAHSYSMGRETAKRWAQDGRFVLMLDGLDEVAEEHRLACLNAINAFQADHDVPMVVCSRVKDYEALQAQLHLAMGVYLEKLSVAQMDNYLARFGEETAGVRHVVQQNQTMQELGESPLMLSLMPFGLWRGNGRGLGHGRECG